MCFNKLQYFISIHKAIILIFYLTVKPNLLANHQSRKLKEIKESKEKNKLKRSSTREFNENEFNKDNLEKEKKRLLMKKTNTSISKDFKKAITISDFSNNFELCTVK